MRDVTRERGAAEAWLPWTDGPPRAGLRRVFCLPYAGGAAAGYRSWTERAEAYGIEVVPVELPGRGTRWTEEPVAAMDRLVDALNREVFARQTEPFALFGHSMGAHIAFAVAAALEQEAGDADGAGGLCHLFVSACRAPGVSPPRLLHALPDDALLAALGDMGGTPPEVLGNAELMGFALPMIRADLTLLERWRPEPGLRIACPVTALGGDDDPLAGPATLGAWREFTRASFAHRVFAGDHFYLREHMGAILHEMGRSLPPR
ncbi:alpha/beta fold hydrolase [Streptomyces sp. NPDC003717]|uniref:thioesterase II family protein n=1 Tax=Streptomyces sp. NPDC003717 TaxID=3154276 RepID=UPI0033BEBA4E